MGKDQAETFTGPLDAGTGGELWSLHHMDPPGQRMFDPNAWILVQTHPSIQHPARYVEAWTIRQTTVREADEGNQKIQVHRPPGKMRLQGEGARTV